MKENPDHNPHELTEDELSAVTGGIIAVLVGGLTAESSHEPTPQPPTPPTTYGEAFNMLQKAAGGTPR